jgi:hypothetical protein
MRGARFADLLVWLASLGLPRAVRAEWREEWQSELWYEARRREQEGVAGKPSLARIAAGAFADVRAARAHLSGVPAGAGMQDGMTARAGGMMRELRISLRSLGRSPGLTIIAIITL